MLVLTRHNQEYVAIGDPANPIGYVHVVAIKGDRVRLGFSFPKNLEVHRGELLSKFQQERKTERD